MSGDIDLDRHLEAYLAIRLTIDDVRLDARPAHLRVLESKFRKSRLVPIDPTTATALAG